MGGQIAPAVHCSRKKMRRQRGNVLLGCTVILVAGFCAFASGNAFAQAPSQKSAQPVADTAIGRGDLRRLLPAAMTAATVSVLPHEARAESGVTEAWGKTLNGEDDEIHVGGVKWEDIEVGKGPSPIVGQLVAIEFNITAEVKDEEVVIDSTKADGRARDFRFGVGQMLPGMDEGMKTMKLGGTRKMFIPAKNAFKDKPIPAAKGRPAIPPNSNLEAYVTLRFIPGALEYDDDE